MPRFAIVHDTTYHYEGEVSSSYGQIHMLPRSFDGQRCLNATVSVDPVPRDLRERTDFFGNRVSYFAVDAPHEILRITAKSEVEVRVDIDLTASAEQRSLSSVLAALDDLEGSDLAAVMQYRSPSPRISLGDEVRQYAAPSFADDQPLTVCLKDLFERIHRDFRFMPGATTVTSTVADLFEEGAGVCQDFAHLAVACIRAQGVPARYVSGYLETDPPPGKEKVVGADVSHAWASAFVPRIGWIDIDPTNSQFVNDRYITTGWGRDYGDIAPLRGVIFGRVVQSELDVSVDVRRLD